MTRLRPVFGYWHTYLWGLDKTAPVDAAAAVEVADMMLDVKTFTNNAARGKSKSSQP